MLNNPLRKCGYFLLLVLGLLTVNVFALFWIIIFAFTVVLRYLFNSKSFDETIRSYCLHAGVQNPLARDSGVNIFVELSNIQIGEFLWSWRYNS